jgi:hypothetical protein
LLNNIDKPKSDSGSNVGLDAFYEYFKNQNETPDGDDEVTYQLLFHNNEINSFTISVNTSIVEYSEFSGGMYTHPNKNSSEKISLENCIY